MEIQYKNNIRMISMEVWNQQTVNSRELELDMVLLHVLHFYNKNTSLLDLYNHSLATFMLQHCNNNYPFHSLSVFIGGAAAYNE